MMEFFISKFWAFLVSIVIMGVLVQGIQMESQSDRNEALNDMAEDLRTLFEEFAAAGEGLETTVHLDRVLSSTSTLTLFIGYCILEDGDREVRFAVPAFLMQIPIDQGKVLEVDRLVLGPTDSLRLMNDAEGPTLTKLSP
ncbi:MAG: hypothetical protein AB9860_05805 [Methanomassiliicoccales archaeon]